MDPPKIKYYDPYSVIVINHNGQMRQLFVPFKVKVIEHTSVLVKDAWLVVEEIISHETHRLLYRIGNQWWPYYAFKIEVRF